MWAPWTWMYRYRLAPPPPPPPPPHPRHPLHPPHPPHLTWRCFRSALPARVATAPPWVSRVGAVRREAAGWSRRRGAEENANRARHRPTAAGEEEEVTWPPSVWLAPDR